MSAFAKNENWYLSHVMRKLQRLMTVTCFWGPNVSSWGQRRLIKLGDAWLLMCRLISVFVVCIWATSWKNLFMPYANNKGADQPAHRRIPISTFVIRCLDSIIPLVSIPKISRLASLCSWAGLLEPFLVANPKDRFSDDSAPLLLSLCR